MTSQTSLPWKENRFTEALVGSLLPRTGCGRPRSGPACVAIETPPNGSDPEVASEGRCASNAGGTRGITAWLDIDVDTVSKWRKRFALEGLAGLKDRPRRVGPTD